MVLFLTENGAAYGVVNEQPVSTDIVGSIQVERANPDTRCYTLFKTENGNVYGII